MRLICYLFPVLTDDPVVNRLHALRDHGEPCPDIYPELFAFTGALACTEHTVREYVLRRVLASPPYGVDIRFVRDYLMHDATMLFDRFFRPDWDKLCRNTGLLPFPVRAASSQPAGEEAYHAILSRMVQAASPEELCSLITDFFARYADETEAMYRACNWDGGLQGIAVPDRISFSDLCGLEHQKTTILENTASFLQGGPSNDVLLVGGSGTGKSSCVRAALNRFADEGLRLVSLPRSSLHELPRLMELLRKRKLRYLIFIDDLSFQDADQSYLELKVALDGQAGARADNVLICATSNRRHLIRETWKDRDRDEDIHENDTLHEKLSLSERFGIRLYFSILSQEEYFRIIRAMLARNSVEFTEETAKEAAAWAIENNGRSGRTARQFVAAYLAKQKAQPD